jgi:hypothetical protein
MIRIRTAHLAITDLSFIHGWRGAPRAQPGRGIDHAAPHRVETK